nr:integrase, catalytic region, zinc finger, CCHC-type, peptidase aspartic, catalytic [Tanacetum cinerariifolium]
LLELILTKSVSSTSQSANKKQEFVKNDNKKAKKKDDEKKRDMSGVKCYNCKKEGHFAKDCKKVKVKDYEYYKTKMLLAKKDKDEQQTSSLKPYVLNVILEKIIIDLEDEVVSLLEKEKANLETIESLKSKGFESSENVSFKSVIAPGMFKLNVSWCISPISMSKLSCDSNNVENLDTFSSVRRPKHSSVVWKKKGSSNTSNVDLSAVNVLKLNKNVKRCDLLDDNNLFIFDDVNVRISPVSKMPFRKKLRDFMHVRSKSNSNKSLPRTVHTWLPKLQPLAEPVAKWFRRIVQICLWIINLGCLKQMTGNRALLTNFVEKFFRTVRFGNNDFAVIAGYGDVVIGSMTIKKVYYVEA